MATLYMLCGMTGSGKSTLARKLEAEHHALRLLPDEWIARLGLPERDPQLRAEIERIQMEIAARALSRGCDVVMEAGFWSRRERNEGRAVARAAGAAAKVIYLDAPMDELKRRIAARNLALPPYSFFVEPGELEGWAEQFEPPTADELG